MINFYLLVGLIGLFFQFAPLSNLTKLFRFLNPLSFPGIIWYFFIKEESILYEINSLQKTILYGITLSFGIGSIFSFREKGKKNIDFFIFLYFLLGVSLALETNLFFIFIKLEFLTVIGSALIAIESESFSYKAIKDIGLRYFICHAFAGLLFLIGIAFISKAGFSYNIYELQVQNFTIGHYFIISSLLINSAVPLFSFWLTKGYSSTRFSTSFAMFPVVTKLSIFFLYIICARGSNLDFLKIIAIVTMLYGSIITLFEMDIRKFLAYASISHNGLLLLFVSKFNDAPFAESSEIFNFLLISSFSGQVILLSILFTITQNAKSYFFLDVEKSIKKYKLLFLMTILGNVIFIGMPFTIGFEVKNLIIDKINYPWKSVLYFIIATNIISHLFILPYRIFRNREINFSANSFSQIDYIKNFITTLIPIFISFMIVNINIPNFDQINKYIQLCITSGLIFIIFYKMLPKNRHIILDFDFIFGYFKAVLDYLFIYWKYMQVVILKFFNLIVMKFFTVYRSRDFLNQYSAVFLSIFIYLIYFYWR